MKQTPKGFTLFETLVAMMVLSITLVILFQLFSGGLTSARVSDDYTRAVFHAREKTEEIMLAETLADGKYEGKFDDTYRWKAEIVYFEDKEHQKQLVDMFGIRVLVIWNDGNQEKNFEINTLKLAQKFQEPEAAK